MSKQSRFQDAVRSVWERSYHAYDGWPEARRNTATPAVDAQLAELREHGTEAELDVRYWETGDPLGETLRPHLPQEFDAETRLTLEEACLWMRLLELRGET